VRCSMEELMELREYIEQGRYADALVLIGEMEEMSRDDKINKFGSYLTILLLHLIKQHAEKRTTRSWDVSIQNTVQQMAYVNKRRKAGGFYLSTQEIREALEAWYDIALRQASLEAFGGVYPADELAAMINNSAVKEEALGLILEAQERLV
jgi:hypothetical protein